MARTAIDIVVTVKDGASAPLDNVKNKIRGAGKAAKDTTADFVQFNKTLFTIGAFIGAFSRSISGMKNAMDMGGDLDRLSNQFDRVLGPKGNLFKSLDSMTTTAIGRMDAMKAALDLKQLGITGSIGDTAEIIAKAGTAAKLAGMDAGEGVKKFTDFLKDGSVANLEALSLMKRTDPAFQAVMASLNKAGGIYGTMISTQEKLSIGMKLLNMKVRGHLKDARDLKDINVLLNDSFGTLKQQIGRLIGTALGPLIAKLAPLVYQLGDTLEHILKNEKHIVFFTKSVITLTGALGGLVAVLGVLKLTVKLLAFAGIGLPGLTFAILTLGSAFIGLTRNADSIMDKFNALGAVFKGIYELVTNFDPETGMSKISKSTKEMLEKYGLLGFVDTITRIIVVTKTVVGDLIGAIKTLGGAIDSVFGGLFTSAFDILNKFTSTWTTWWTTDSLSPIKKFIRAAVVLLGGLGAIFAGKKLFDIFSGAMGKIPGIGKLFGGNAPKGTQSDPMYVKNADGPLGSIGVSALSGAGGFKTLIDLLKQSYVLGGWKQILKDIPAAFSLAFPVLGRIFGSLIGAITSIPGMLARIPAMLGGIVSAISAALPVIAAGLAAAAGPLLIAAVIAGVSFIIYKILDAINEKLGFTTKEGYKGDFLENMFFKMDKFFGGEASTKWMEGQKAEENLKNSTNQQLVDQFRQQQQNKAFTKVGMLNTSIDQDETILNAVGTQMQTLSAAKAQEMQKAMESAYASKEAGGRYISPEELDGIKNAYKQALSEDENLRAMGEKARNSRVQTIQQPRD